MAPRNRLGPASGLGNHESRHPPATGYKLPATGHDPPTPHPSRRVFPAARQERANHVPRGFAAYLIFRKMGGGNFVGLKPHAPSVEWNGWSPPNGHLGLFGSGNANICDDSMGLASTRPPENNKSEFGGRDVALRP